MRTLTPMQVAYWMGRTSDAPLGGVASHLYAEFDGNRLDPARLAHALTRLAALHPMLRLRIDTEGMQSVDGGELTLTVEDLRALPAAACAQRLQEKREAWTHQRLDLTSGPAAAFGLSVLPEGGARLHVDTDMLAIDPASFRIVMEDLARLYQQPEAPGERALPSFFAWVDRLNGDPDLRRRRERDRLWWRERLATIAPAPDLPLATRQDVPKGQTTRLSTFLAADQRHSLQRSARARRITSSTLMLGLFAASLGEATRSARFRLNVPMFFRAGLVEGVERIVGEFSNVLILSVDLDASDTLGALCQSLGRQMTELLTHSAYPGVNVMRDLSRQRAALQLSPVVFTAGLDLPGGELFSERVTRGLGKLVWAVSQGPQVALDAQVAAMDGGVLINWDVRLDALPRRWIEALFERYVARVRSVAEDADLLDAPLRAQEAASATETMLIDLLRRLLPSGAVDAASVIPALGIPQAEISDMLAFLNRYVPEAALSLEDVAGHRTPARLARLVRTRSGDGSEKVARAFLDAVRSAV